MELARLFLLFLSIITHLTAVHGAQNVETKRQTAVAQAKPTLPAAAVQEPVAQIPPRPLTLVDALKDCITESQSEIDKLKKKHTQLISPDQKEKALNRAWWDGFYAGVYDGIRDVVCDKRVVFATTAIAGLLLWRNWTQIKQFGKRAIDYCYPITNCNRASSSLRGRMLASSLTPKP